MRDHILFHINGREHRVEGETAFTTLANWLRYDAGATGCSVYPERSEGSSVRFRLDVADLTGDPSALRASG